MHVIYDLQWLRPIRADGTVIKHKARFLCGHKYLLHTHMYCKSKISRATVSSRKRKKKCFVLSVPVSPLSVQSWPCDSDMWSICSNRPVPNRKFFLWNSTAVVQGSLQRARADPKSHWAAEPSHVSLDLSIWPALGNVHCGVKDEPISHKELYLVTTISVTAIT